MAKQNWRIKNNIAKFDKLKKESELKVKDGCVGVFKFTVYLNGLGKAAEEAWNDACEAVAIDGLGFMPENSDVELIDEEPE